MCLISDLLAFIDVCLDFLYYQKGECEKIGQCSFQNERVMSTMPTFAVFVFVLTSACVLAGLPDYFFDCSEFWLLLFIYFPYQIGSSSIL